MSMVGYSTSEFSGNEDSDVEPQFLQFLNTTATRLCVKSRPSGNGCTAITRHTRMSSFSKFSRLTINVKGNGIVTADENSKVIHPGVRIGHVHLKVADLQRSLHFYCEVLGFEITQRYGSQAAFISAGGYHHHIGLNTWESLGGSPPPAGTTGLYHVAILYPTRQSLADALRCLIAAGISLDGASDHGVSEALYLRDPDENGIELYWDRPQDEWPRSPEGELAMFTQRLDLNQLLQEAEANS